MTAEADSIRGTCAVQRLLHTGTLSVNGALQKSMTGRRKSFAAICAIGLVCVPAWVYKAVIV